jgi:hypothetical protein
VHTRGQLTHGERLRHVVVGAHAEPDQHVRLVVARGEHHDRHRAGRLDAPADLQAVETRQHDVEDQQVGLPCLGRVHGGRSVTRCLHEEPFGAQPGGDGVDDRRIVLDHQHPALSARRGRRAVVRGVCLLHRPPLRVLSGTSGVIP